jgi:high-affinity nickel permease
LVEKIVQIERGLIINTLHNFFRTKVQKCIVLHDFFFGFGFKTGN